MLERTFTGTPDHFSNGSFSMFDEEHDFSFGAAPRPEVNVDTALISRSVLFRVRSTGHRIELTERSKTMLLMVRRGSARFRTQRREFTAKAGDLILMTPNSRATTVVPGDRGAYLADCVAVFLPPERLATVLDDAGSSVFEEKFPGTATNRPDDPLRRYLAFLFSEAERRHSLFSRHNTAEAAEIILEDEILGLIGLPRERERSDTSHSPSDLRLVRQAEDVMRADLEEPLSIASIAANLRVSPRRLQLAFAAVAGVAPRDRLNELRLERAHERLRMASPAETVSSIALETGFVHVGRFARAYADRYGEFPSQTLRRERG